MLYLKSFLNKKNKEREKMKSLKKLAAVGALMGVMNFAKAEEVTFKPTNFDGGEIESIELVNGQLMVKSNGNIAGVETPYVFVGTNTQHFAQNAFAQEGWDKADSLVHDGKNIYLTEPNNTSNVIHTLIKDSPELNGVIGRKCRKDNDLTDKILQNKGQLIALDGEDVYTVSDDAVYKNGASHDFCGAMKDKRKDALVVANGHGYVLAEGRIYNADSGFNQGIEADSMVGCGKYLVYSLGNTVTVYDADRKTVVATQEISQNNQPTQKIKSAVVANDTIYYATAKKLGYKKIER